MAIQSLVIEVSAATPADAQTSINAALATAGGIAAADYLESLVIAYKEKNQTALIVIWYDDGA